MKRPLLHLLTALSLLSLSACTSFNLTEQLTNANKRVPVVLPDKKVATYYKLDGKYYRALTVAMAEEHIPLLTSISNTRRGPYHSFPTYTPDASTAQLCLFQLTHSEAEAVQDSLKEIRGGFLYVPSPPKSKDEPGVIPPMVKAKDFDFTRARRYTIPLQHIAPRTQPTATGYRQYPYYHVWSHESGQPYAITALPTQDSELSTGRKIALAPVWVLDTAGNIVIAATETAVAIPVGIIGLPILGILHLCGERLP